jgi:putative transcriptional regulator
VNKAILDVIHETAKGLHEAGVLNIKTMREFDTLCLAPVKTYTPEQIKNIRLKNQVSQAIFAAYLNTSLSTVQRWEQGGKKPNGPALRLLNLVERKGLDILAD